MKMACLAALAVAIAVLFSTPASAYIDPNAGSLVAQMVVAGVAGLLVFLRLFWQKIKRLFTKNDR